MDNGYKTLDDVLEVIIKWNGKVNAATVDVVVKGQ